jgi:hypothetical protein
MNQRNASPANGTRFSAKRIQRRIVSSVSQPSFGLIVNQTDAEREYAYDAHPKSSGKLASALAAAPQRGGNVVDMRKDRKAVFAQGE